MLFQTNMDEFGMGSGAIDSIFGPVKSLWRSGIPYKLTEIPSLNEGCFEPETSQIAKNDWVIAGGSSGGSVVAVSSGVCFASLGNT